MITRGITAEVASARFRDVSRCSAGVGVPAGTYGALATVGGRLARPAPCVARHDRSRDRRLLAVMPGCRWAPHSNVNSVTS